MGHDWVFDVLKDLRTYAQANGFSALAAKADEALQIARAEIPGNLDSDDTSGSAAGRKGHKSH